MTKRAAGTYAGITEHAEQVGATQPGKGNNADWRIRDAGAITCLDTGESGKKGRREKPIRNVG